MATKPTIIVFADSDHSACSFWRAIGPFNELERQGLINVIRGTYNESWTTLRRADMAFFQRPMSKRCKEQIFMAKDVGLKVWIDLDDYNVIPEYHPVYNVYENEFDEKLFFKYMILADIVTVSTDFLKQHYLQYANNIEIVQNAINDHWLSFKKHQQNNIIFLRGGDHHDHDIYHYKDALIGLVNKHGMKLIVCGSNPIYLQQEIDNYVYAGNFNVHGYFAYILRFRPSIFALPFIDCDFNRGKSNIGFLEATLAGSASLTPSYWGLEKYSSVYSDIDTFHSSLEEMITNPELCNENHSKAVELAKSDYLLSMVNNKRIEIINKLIG